jgi:hypothetical protein
MPGEERGDRNAVFMPSLHLLLNLDDFATTGVAVGSQVLHLWEQLMKPM